MKNLVLFGFMGSGKTSAGKLAAKRLGLTFVDMDHLIEERHRRTISEIFEKEGEPTFRRYEKELVKELAAHQGQVISTGGGVVLDPENVQDFGRTGVLICCQVDAAHAHERTKKTKHRPLLETEGDRFERLAALLKQREPLYHAIPNQVDTTRLTDGQQVDEIVWIYQQQAGGKIL